MDSSFYRENLLDHYRNPRFHGQLDAPTVSQEDLNPLCGDMIRIDLALDGGMVADARFSGHGCAVSQAAASMLLEEIVGKSVEEVAALGRDDLLELLGVPLSPARLKCALLSLGVLRAGLHAAGAATVTPDR